MNISQTCNDPPTTSTFRSEYETSYAPFNRRSSLSPSPPSSPSTASYRDSVGQHEESLHSVLGSSRVTKAGTSSFAHYRSHHYAQSVGLTQGINHMHAYHGIATRPQSSTYRSSPYGTPRSNNRLPSVIDRMKADLKAPHRSAAPTSLQQHYHQHPMSPTDRGCGSPLSPQPMYSEMRFEDGPLQPAVAPTLFGVRCTEVSQKAYTGQSSQMKKSFDRLQCMDSGKVEYRTIAFCTHLTVSRWEPVILATPSAASSEDSACQASSSSIAAAKNDSGHAARLMSLANYIRHILSLTAGNPNTQAQMAVKQQQQQQQQRRQDQPREHESSSHGAHPAPSESSSGPGPIKSDSARRHRYAPDYHHHLARRNIHSSTAHPYPQPDTSTHSQRRGLSYEHGYREENFGSELQEYQGRQQGTIPFHPHQYRQHAPALQSRENCGRAMPNQPSPLRTTAPPLLKIPHPNLTLTLALIYVDRLKAKYPDAKGEPGCSHRLFLVAFIIAAKYRCSVELSPHLPEDIDNDRDQDEHFPKSMDTRRSSNSDSEFFKDGPLFTNAGRSTLEQSLEARLNAELIFSNHAWVRLLNLGSFYRQPSPSAAVPSTSSQATAAASGQVPTPPTRPVSSSPPNAPEEPSTPHSPSPTTSTNPHQREASDPLTQPRIPSISSIIHPMASSPTATMLQVEDLDRMEAEFLTFLSFDLATMSHDLETCWNLLVGKIEAQA